MLKLFPLLVQSMSTRRPTAQFYFEDKIPRQMRNSVCCGNATYDCSSKVLPYLYLCEAIFLVCLISFLYESVLFYWVLFLRVLSSTTGAMRCTFMCRVLLSEFLGSLYVGCVVLITHWSSLPSLWSGGTWDTHCLANVVTPGDVANTIKKTKLSGMYLSINFEIARKVWLQWAEGMPLY